MRKRYLLILIVPLVALLALGALPSLLGGGDTHYVVATEVDAPDEGVESLDAANLSENRFPYTTQALEEGTSDPYEEGPFGLKESFTHTPFDEFSELEIWNAEAVDGDTVLVERDGSYYRLELTETPETDD
ncbi:hypothetical protein [Natrononativus amylolyticus]|uniref:hypothetical protein n=1 Tax=Natrononativus amylolyticus TaxID=2963434 RepID=UPI0020CF01F1|nr:hypothetical protein [Natrononativus amylolyticus]